MYTFKYVIKDDQMLEPALTSSISVNIPINIRLMFFPDYNISLKKTLKIILSETTGPISI